MRARITLPERSRRHAAMIALTWLAFAWRVWGLTAQSFWRDEVDALRFATRPWPEMLATFTKPGENGPLFFLLLRPWLAIAGHSEYALRFTAVCAGVVAVPLAMILAARLGWPRTASLAVGLFMATNPYLTWYSQEGKMYALITALALASSLAFVQAIRRGGYRRWALYWLLTTLCFYIHVLAVLLIPLHLLWFLTGWTTSRHQWRGYAIALAGLTLPYLPLVKWQYKLLTASWFNPGFPFLPLDQMATVLLLAFTRGFYPVSNAWSVMPAVFLALAGLWIGHDRIRRFGVPPLAWLTLWLLFPALALFAISLRVPLFTDRYLIWIAPALWLLAGLGVAAVRPYSRWIALLALGSVIALNLQATAYHIHTPIKSDFRQATAWVEQQRQPEEAVMLLMPYLRYTYTYYAGHDVPLVEPPYTNAGMTPEQVDDEMRHRLAGRQGVWLVISEEEMWDRRGLVRAWLDEHAEAIARKSFARVEVIHYRLNSLEEK
ncbi:MAG: hypothetical protein GXP39_15385 [Chloroflexi bacterium]|nr:hypothetical protein [Chloroflexota bacterium]